MKKPIKISQQVIDVLTPRIGDEFKAFYHYRNASNWCKDKGFMKAASFFEAESSSELEHAKGIENYLVDWNVMPILPMIDAPVGFESLVDIIEKSYNLELDLYESYESDSLTLMKEKEVKAFDFLQKYREIQRSSVAEYSDMMNILEGCKEGDKFQLLMLEEQLFGG